MQAPVIAIIGGGFCGMLTAVHLCREADSPLHLILINKGSPFARGLAYSPHSHQYLLNVRARSMSAFADEPVHFVEWLQQHPLYKHISPAALSTSFIPRTIYGEYLESIWQHTMATKPSFVTISMIEETAVDIQEATPHYNIHLQNNRHVTADYIILATGNSQPRPLPFTATHSSLPWSTDTLSLDNTTTPVLIAGNGLTMADTVTGLREQGFTGVIHTISPNGYALKPHSQPDLSYFLSAESIATCSTLRQWKEEVYKQITQARAASLPDELVIDALRPYTTNAWQQFSYADKQDFLRHSAHFWNILRHRLPHSIHAALEREFQAGTFAPHKGVIQQTEKDSNGGIHVNWYNCISRNHRQLHVQKIINCTGPGTDITQSSNPLLKNLSSTGLLKADELKLGLWVNAADYSVIDANGNNHRRIVTLGTNLKGLLWESTAVPELRVQCKQVAVRLLQQVNHKEKACI